MLKSFYSCFFERMCLLVWFQVVQIETILVISLIVGLEFLTFQFLLSKYLDKKEANYLVSSSRRGDRKSKV